MMKKKPLGVVPTLTLLRMTLEAMRADHVKYPQLRLPEMQAQRLEAALMLLTGE